MKFDLVHQTISPHERVGSRIRLNLYIHYVQIAKMEMCVCTKCCRGDENIGPAIAGSTRPDPPPLCWLNICISQCLVLRYYSHYLLAWLA